MLHPRFHAHEKAGVAMYCMWAWTIFGDLAKPRASIVAFKRDGLASGVDNIENITKNDFY